jgi:GH18 family chitinase
MVFNVLEKLVCYWFAEMDASKIDVSICTHIIYSFLGVDSNGGLNHLQRSEAQAIGKTLIAYLHIF